MSDNKQWTKEKIEAEIENADPDNWGDGIVGAYAQMTEKYLSALTALKEALGENEKLFHTMEERRHEIARGRAEITRLTKISVAGEKYITALVLAKGTIPIELVEASDAYNQAKVKP